MRKLTSEDKRLLHHWISISGKDLVFGISRERHVFIDNEGCVDGGGELLFRLGYDVTDEVEDSDSNMLYNYYEGVSLDDLRSEHGFTEYRLMTDEEIAEVIHTMPDAIEAYSGRDLKATYEFNGVAHLYEEFHQKRWR